MVHDNENAHCHTLIFRIGYNGCPKKPATPQAAYPEFEEVDLPDDDELDDLPEAGDKDIK